MKKLLLLVLLASCTTKGPDYTPDQQAIIKYVQHSEPDSARYVPLLFSKPQPYTRLDSVSPVLAQYTELSDQAADYMLRAAKLVDASRAGHAAPARLAWASHVNDSAKAAYNQLMNTRSALLKRATAKAVVGQEITHSWRVGERVDSAHFVVFNNGAVKRLR